MPRRPKTTTTATAAPPVPLSAALRRELRGLQKPFNSFVQSFRLISIDREKFAPVFMKTFGHWKKEVERRTGKRAEFTNFVRMLDPSIGPSRADYRAHHTYQAADYLRRKMSPTTRDRVATGRATALDLAARAIAALVQLVPNTEREALWKTLTTQAKGWTPRQLARLQKRTESVTPLVDVRTARGGANLPTLKLVAPHAKAA